MYIFPNAKKKTKVREEVKGTVKKKEANELISKIKK